MDQVGYVILFVGDLERSVAFYRDVIGLPFKLRGDGYVEFATQGAKFGLYDRNRLEELTGQGVEPPRSPGGEVVLLVEDVDAEARAAAGGGGDHPERAGGPGLGASDAARRGPGRVRGRAGRGNPAATVAGPTVDSADRRNVRRICPCRSAVPTSSTSPVSPASL